MIKVTHINFYVTGYSQSTYIILAIGDQYRKRISEKVTLKNTINQSFKHNFSYAKEFPLEIGLAKE